MMNTKQIQVQKTYCTGYHSNDKEEYSLVYGECTITPIHCSVLETNRIWSCFVHKRVNSLHEHGTSLLFR